MTVGHRVERQHKPQGSEQASSVKGKPQSHAPPTTMRTGSLSKQSHSPVTSSGTPTATTQAQRRHPALEMSFGNLSLDSILGEHGQPRLLQRPSDAPHIPLLGEVLTASPLAGRKLDSWCWTPVTEWPARLHMAGTGKSQILGGGGGMLSCRKRKVILLPRTMAYYHGPLPDGARRSREASRASLTVFPSPHSSFSLDTAGS